MARRPDKIDEERVCIDSLVQHLKGIESDSPIGATKEPEDPPDYWLTVGQRRFAVEITSIVKDEGHAALCNSLIAEIKDQCESGRPIEGTYAVEFFRRPEMPRRGSNEWKRLVGEAAAKITAMTGSPIGSEAGLLHHRGGSLSIAKWSNKGSTVGMTRGEGAKREGEARDDLAKLLTDAIDKKSGKLRRKGIAGHTILALYDAYGYADVETARQALSTTNGYAWLHSIYWAASFTDRANILYPDSPGRSGAFLYTECDAWRTQATKFVAEHHAGHTKDESSSRIDGR